MRPFHPLSRRLLIFLLSVGGFALTHAGRSACAAESDGYSIETKTVGRAIGTLSYAVAYPDFHATDWTVCASQAPILPGQIKVTTTLRPKGASARDQSDLARGLIMAQVRADSENFDNALSVEVRYEATLRSRHLRRGSRGGRASALTSEERALYLADRGFMDFTAPAFADWLQSQKVERSDREGDIAFARRVFLGLKSGMQYDAARPHQFRASLVCNSGRADCGGLSILFAAILRANKIPARTLWGRWAASTQPGKMLVNHPYYQTHVKAEFYARGVGWVPVDVSSGILHDRSPEGLKYFGNDAGDFITFHVDPNFVIDSRLFGVKQVAQLQIPALWVKGKGTLKNHKASEDWQVLRTRHD